MAPVNAAPRAAWSDLVVGCWGARFLGRRFACAIGHAGIVWAKREGDGATPAGLCGLTTVYWRADRQPAPETILPCRPIAPWLGWSDDPLDSAYNRPVRHPHLGSAEHLFRADRLYDIVVVTDHNTAPTVAGAGSAIFLHIWRRPRYPTAGCIGFCRSDLLWILSRWTPRSRVIVRPH